MVTTVGTESNIADLLNDLIQLDYDAADAYQAAIDQLENPSYRAALGAFREDHLRHVSELSAILSAMGGTPPTEGDIKSILTQGKVMLGGLIGDRAILEAMRTNEADTNTAYGRAVGYDGLDGRTLEALQRGLADERKHCEWVLSALGRAD